MIRRNKPGRAPRPWMRGTVIVSVYSISIILYNDFAFYVLSFRSKTNKNITKAKYSKLFCGMGGPPVGRAAPPPGKFPGKMLFIERDGIIYVQELKSCRASLFN